MQNEDANIATAVAAELPYLRRYARALTGSQASGDRYAATTLEAILADKSAFERDLAPRVALFKVFHSIWSTTGGKAELGDEMTSPLEAKAQERLRALTPNTREAVLLNTMENLLPSDIAKIMLLEEDEVHTLLREGLADMAQAMKGRVLIIEDEPIIAMDLASIVEEAGHIVVGNARTRSEAVAMEASESPDLILADVQLADGSSGIDAANDILARKPDLPVVFITAYPERLLTGDRPEPAFLITKPFTEEQVRLAVSQSLFFASSAVLA